MPDTFTLTAEQFAAFEDRGVVRLPTFYPRADIDLMAYRLWSDLKARYGIRRDDPESWTVPMPAQFQALNHSGAFNALGSPKLFDLVDSVMGTGNWTRPEHWGAPLVTFPTPVPIIARPSWHLDIGGDERLMPMPTFRCFTFLEPVLPGGGGTLYVAGSHHLAMEIEHAHGGALRSAYARNRLKACQTASKIDPGSACKIDPLTTMS